MIDILGNTYYTSWIAKILFCVISLIVTGLIIIRFLRQPSRNKPSIMKLLLIIVVSELLIFGALYWDIIIAGNQVSKMCREQGGMHIYKTVAAEGMAGLQGMRGWAEYGFSYVEYVDSRGNVIRSKMFNGEIVKESVDEITSQYIRITKREYVARFIDKSFIKKISHSIVDRSSGDVLGELVYFTIDQGWADRWIPGEYTPWTCGNKEMRNGHTYFLTVSTLVKDVVKPLRD